MLFNLHQYIKLNCLVCKVVKMERLDEKRGEFNLNVFQAIDSDNTFEQLKTELSIIKMHAQSLKLENQTLSAEKEKLEKTLTAFKNMPAIVGAISEIFIEKKRAVIRTHTGVTFYINIPETFKEKININDRVVLAQSNLAMLDVLPPEKDYRALAFEINEKPNVSLKEIGGLKEIIQEVEETVILPMTNPQIFKKFNVESPKGVLLHGPPGTGKTMIAKAIASKTNSTFISLSGSELVHKYIGEGAKVVKDLFKLAKEKSPTVIFIDEIDSVAGYRMENTTGADREVNRTMTQLLVEMDGFKESDNIKVIAATNRIDILDKAVLRPGRFDRIVEIYPPRTEDRKDIFNIYLQKVPMQKLDFEEIIEKTEGASGAEIKLICKEAAIFAIRENKNKVTQKNMLDAINKILKKNVKEEQKRIYR